MKRQPPTRVEAQVGRSAEPEQGREPGSSSAPSSNEGSLVQPNWRIGRESRNRAEMGLRRGIGLGLGQLRCWSGRQDA